MSLNSFDFFKCVKAIFVMYCVKPFGLYIISNGLYIVMPLLVTITYHKVWISNPSVYSYGSDVISCLLYQ